jgi:acyl-CoA synthetase (AMP-forming)/AMP-acid ligase II
MGAVAVPIMEDFPESDIDHILSHSDSVALFISSALHQSLNLNNLRKLAHIIRLDDFASLPEKDGDDGLWAQIQKLPKKIMRSIAKPAPAEAPGPGEDDPAEILYTSGTTGQSKGVVLTHRNLVSNLFEGPNHRECRQRVLAFIVGSARPEQLLPRPAARPYLGKKPSPGPHGRDAGRPHHRGVSSSRRFTTKVLPPPRKKGSALAGPGGTRTVHRLVGRKIRRGFEAVKCAMSAAPVNPGRNRSCAGPHSFIVDTD